MNPLFTSLLLVTPVLLTLALGIVGFALRYQRRLLQQQDLMRSEREKFQFQSLEAALLAQEDERRRIAADLHDSVGTMLAIAKLHLNTIPGCPASSEVGQMMDQAIAEVRRISRNLLPAVLEKFGLVFAVEALCRAVPEGGPKVAFLQQGENNTRLLPHQELALYRIMQELLGNGLRHAKASHITLGLTFDGDSLTLEYSDDGVGFDPGRQETTPPPAGARSGLGLTNLRSRVIMLHGTMHHDSTAQTGTRVFISVPTAYFPAAPAAAPVPVAAPVALSV